MHRLLLLEGTESLMRSAFSDERIKNPFWGTAKETFEKVKEFYSTDKIFTAQPVPGAREGVTFLRNRGYKLVIVTARAQDSKDQSWIYVAKHFPGILHLDFGVFLKRPLHTGVFDSIICTGQFKDAHKAGHDAATKLSKAQVNSG